MSGRWVRLPNENAAPYPLEHLQDVHVERVQLDVLFEPALAPIRKSPHHRVLDVVDGECRVPLVDYRSPASLLVFVQVGRLEDDQRQLEQEVVHEGRVRVRRHDQVL